MFAQALRKITPITKPVLTMAVLRNGTLRIGCATFIVVNADGWVITAAHVLKELAVAKQHIAEYDDHNRKIEEIRNSSNLSKNQRSKKLQALKPNAEWLEEVILAWQDSKAKIEQYITDDLADIAVIKLTEFDTSDITDYPIFKNPADNFWPGTSLCRLGFPFAEIKANYDSQNKRIEFTDETQLPLFPNEGMYTREVELIAPDNSRSVKLIETSTPGLRGQSGGPIFDTNGHVWGIQSHTRHFRLGFSPSFKEGNKEVVEHQYLNTGYGAHVQEVVQLLDAYNVSFNLSQIEQNDSQKEAKAF